MTTITINEKTKKGKMLLQYLRTMYESESFVSFDVPNAETCASMDDAQKGKVTKCKSTSDLMQKLRS